MSQLYDGVNEVTGGLVLEEHQKRTRGKKLAKGDWMPACSPDGEISQKRKGVSVDSDLTPGAAPRFDRYSMMRLRSCLQSLGRFLWHTVNMVWKTALAAASVTLTGKQEPQDSEDGTLWFKGKIS